MQTSNPLTIRDRYTLHCRIGKGAFANVWKAADEVTGGFVALKQLEPKGQKRAVDQGFIKEVMSEINLLSKLNHPNIVKYRGCFLEQNYLYIILELVDFGSLQTLIKQYDGLGENIVACYIYQILLGLKYLHEQGIIHKDIKAANILMTSSGLCKLTDFGLSQRLQDVDPTVVEGSPYWLAPEVINEEGVSTKSDVWSLGATMIELLTKKPPFHNLTGFAAMYNIATLTEMPLPSNISPECTDFLSCCFKIDPHERSSCAELLNHPWIVKNASNLMKHKPPVGAGARGSSKLTLSNNMLPPPKGFSSLESSKEFVKKLSKKDTQADLQEKKACLISDTSNQSAPVSPNPPEKPSSKTFIRRKAASSLPQASSLTRDSLASRLETVRTKRLERDLEKSESLFGTDPLINVKTDSILSINSESDDLALFPDILDLSDDNKYHSIIGTVINDTSDVFYEEALDHDSAVVDDTIKHAVMSSKYMAPKLNKKAIKQNLRVLEKSVFASYSIVDAHKLLEIISTSQKRAELCCIFRGHIFSQKQREQLQCTDIITDGSGTHHNIGAKEEDTQLFLPHELELETLQPTEIAGVLISNIMERRGFLSVIQHINNILNNIKNILPALSKENLDDICINLNSLYSTHPVDLLVLQNRLGVLREKKQSSGGKSIITPRDRESTGRNTICSINQTITQLPSIPDVDSNQSSTINGYESGQMTCSILKNYNTSPVYSSTKFPSRSKNVPSFCTTGMQNTSMIRPQQYSLTSTMQSSMQSFSHIPPSLKRDGEPILHQKISHSHSLLDEALPSKSINIPFLGSAHDFLKQESTEQYYLSAEGNAKNKKGDSKVTTPFVDQRTIFWNTALVLYMYEYCIELCKILYVLCQYSPRLIMNLTILGLPFLMEKLVAFNIRDSASEIRMIPGIIREIKAQICNSLDSEKKHQKFMRCDQDSQIAIQNDTTSTARSARTNTHVNSSPALGQTSSTQADMIRSLDCRLMTHLRFVYAALRGKDVDDRSLLKEFVEEFKAISNRMPLTLRSFTYSSLPVTADSYIISERNKERIRSSARKGTKDWHDSLHGSISPVKSANPISQPSSVPGCSRASKALECDQTASGHRQSALSGIAPPAAGLAPSAGDRDAHHTKLPAYSEESCDSFQIDPAAMDSAQKFASYPCDWDALADVLQSETRTVVSDLLQVFIDGNFASAEFTSVDYCLILHSQILKLCEHLLSVKDARFAIQVIGIIHKLLFKERPSRARGAGILSPKFLADEREVLDHVVKLYQLDCALPPNKALSAKSSKVGSTPGIHPSKSTAEIPTIAASSYATILITENAYEYIAKSLNILLFWKILPPVLSDSPYNHPTCEVQVVGQRVDWNNSGSLDLDLSSGTSDRIRSILSADGDRGYEASKLKYYLSILAMNERRLQALEQGIEVYSKLVDLDHTHIIFSRDVLKTYISFISCVLMSCPPARPMASAATPSFSRYFPASLSYRIHSIITAFFDSLRRFILMPDFVPSLSPETVNTLVDLLINIQRYRTGDILNAATYLCHSIIQFPEIHSVALSKGLISVCYRTIYGNSLPINDGGTGAGKQCSQRPATRKASRRAASREASSSCSLSPRPSLSPSTEFSSSVVELAAEIIFRTSALRPTRLFSDQQRRQNRHMTQYQGLLEKIFAEFSASEDGREDWLSGTFDLAAAYPNKVLCLLSWFFDCSRYSRMQQSWRRIIGLIVCPANLAKLSVLLDNDKTASSAVGDLARFIKQHESIPQFLSSHQRFLQGLFNNLRTSKQNTTRKGCMDIFEHIYVYASHPRQLVARYNIRPLMIALSYERPAAENGADGHAPTTLAMKAQSFLACIQSFELMQ